MGRQRQAFRRYARDAARAAAVEREMRANAAKPDTTDVVREALTAAADSIRRRLNGQRDAS